MAFALPHHLDPLQEQIQLAGADLLALVQREGPRIQPLVHNSGAENALRPLCLGRKNWLTFGSEAAAHRAMALLTLVQTCKANQVDPFAYLRDVINRVSTHPMSRIDELTPRRWKELRAQQLEQAAA